MPQPAARAAARREGADVKKGTPPKAAGKLRLNPETLRRLDLAGEDGRLVVGVTTDLCNGTSGIWVCTLSPGTEC